MQWVDEDSLNLLSSLISDKTIQYLLLVVVYRNYEVGATNTFMVSLNKMKERGVFTKQFQVCNFKQERRE